MSSPSPVPTPVIHAVLEHGHDWVEIVTLIGTGIAAAGAVTAAIVAALAYRRQGVDRHRAHAALISVKPVIVEAERDSLGLVSTWGAEMINTSDEPAYRCMVMFVDPAGASIATSDIVEVLSPRWTELVRPAAAGVVLAADTYGVGVSFTDRAGVRWYRDERGRLRQLGGDKLPALRRLLFGGPPPTGSG